MSDVFPFNLPYKDLRVYAQGLKRENRDHADTMKRLAEGAHASQTDASGGRLLEVWRSKKYLCQVYRPENGVQRLSICRTEVDTTNRRWRDGLSWDELMEIKSQVGRGDFDAVEIYPAEKDIVNVANLRHLWVMVDQKLTFAWRKKP